MYNLREKIENKIPDQVKKIYQNHKTLILAIIAIAVFVVLYKGYRSYKIAHSAHTEMVSVSVATTVQKNMTVPFSVIGTVAAYNAVNIMSQASGQIMQILFKRGQLVKQGQLLFVIDPRPSEAQLQQQKANLDRDLAQLKYAQVTRQRDKALIGKSYVSRSTYDQDVSTEESDKATVESDKAAIVNAELQLEYSYIHSPITGRTGDIFVDPGNIVESGQYVTLTTINQLQPIYVNFSVPQNYFSVVSENGEYKPLTVSAKVGDEIKTGHLSFVDNQISTTTGTINLKATFPNTDLKLWPGQYVDINLPTASFEKALVVPTVAVQQGANGSYLFVVKPDSTVTYRTVDAGPTVGDETIVLKGLKAGDKVVTSGQLQLTDGSLIKIIPSATTAHEGSQS